MNLVKTPGLVRNTAWAGASELGRAMAGTASFILLARAFGPGNFGRYAGSLALIWALMPFATLGRPHLIVMHVARDPESLHRRWGDALLAVAFGGAAATALLLALRPLLLPGVPAGVLVVLALSEFLASAVAEVGSSAAQAQDRLALCAGVRILFAGSRLAAAVAFTLAGGSALAAFPAFQLAGCAVGAAAALCLVGFRSGWPSRPARPTLRSLAEGLPFSFSAASMMTQDGIDKTILVRSGFVVEAGAYAAAYRSVSLAMLPVTALLQATYARFFRAGASGLASAWQLARRLLAPAVLYGVVVGVGAVVCAPLLSVVLGGDYNGSVPMIRALAFLPLVRIIQYFPANALTGSGHHKLRSACQAATAVCTVATCFVFIPLLGWRGAVLSTLGVELIFAALVWLALAILLKKERRTQASAETEDLPERLMKVA